jgi:stalled ribosome rescue protein Dom34
MKRTVIWIDHVKAYILEYGEEGIHMKTVAPEVDGKFTKEFSRKFYHGLAHDLEAANRILVLGPGMAKEEFKNHCEAHHPKVNHAIVEIKNMKDHPTFEELKHVSKEFMNRDFAWAGP